MIQKSQIAELRKHEFYSENWTIDDLCDTLEALWKVAEAAKELRSSRMLNRPVIQLEENALDSALAALDEDKGAKRV